MVTRINLTGFFITFSTITASVPSRANASDFLRFEEILIVPSGVKSFPFDASIFTYVIPRQIKCNSANYIEISSCILSLFSTAVFVKCNFVHPMRTFPGYLPTSAAMLVI